MEYIHITSPNNGLNRYNEFKAISDTINTLGNHVTVIFSPGEYLIRPPYLDIDFNNIIAGAVQYDVFSLLGCSRIIFIGNGATIKYMDNIPFGIKPATPGDASVHIGSLFRLENCSYININNFICDGNNENLNLLDTYGVGNNPYEREHEGLFLTNSSYIRVKNCSFNNFGRDGALVIVDNGISTNNHFYNCSFDANGRNGFSWTGGNKFTFITCTFSNNSQGIIQTNPGSGLDIEPERNARVTNGRFLNCIFDDNSGYTITSSDIDDAEDFEFVDCTIRNYYNYTLYTGCPKFVFRRTSFVGTILLNFIHLHDGKAPYFYKCSFNDQLIGHSNWHNSYIIALGHHDRFVKCIFTANESSFCYGSDIHTKFTTCTFNANFTTDTDYEDATFVIDTATFNNCIFNKNNPYPDYTLLLDPLKTITLNNCTFN